ncbi:MAG TPA: glycosyltransferase family 39 protein [Verrucomicrobiae bacterium]|jgi:membrane-associated phospholipid phosphatase
MHWLQSLDTTLFHFINHSLGNPFFDWLMPLLSGGDGVMRWFVLLAVAVGLAAIFFGNARARLCALMIVLAVAIGDPLIVNTIKHAVARPRPCIALPDVVERLGCTTSGSMPSAHAANWFAATMIVFLFYRKRIWLTLPMLLVALAVSFSRVYNGVHYPSDVLAGAILGAGYAAAIAVALEAAWQFFGKKFFPLWHAKMPSLLNPKLSTLNPQLSTPGSHWLRLGYFLIFIMLLARWIYIAGGFIGLSGDEAYQWIWSKHLALSYFSKPLGIALIQFAGTHIFGDTELGVRFFSPLFAAILSILVLRFLAREIGARAAFWLLLAVTAVPMLGVGTILMTIDPPLVLCWMWAVVAGWRAAQPDGKTRDWLIVGLAMGLGFLCKYTAACQIVCWMLFFALSPVARLHLRKPGPWLALLLFSLCTLPVLIWNSQNGWITVHHVAHDAGMSAKWHPTLRYFQDFLFTQFGLLNPVFFVGAMWAMSGFWKFRRERPLWLYFFCMSAPLYFGYWLFSLHSRVLPNWPVAAVPPMFCLMAAYWNEKIRAGSRFAKPFFTIGLALGFIATAFMYDSNLIGKIAGQLLPGEKDPSRRVRAWEQAAALVETAREKLEAEGAPAFIIAGDYGITGLFSFYVPQAKAAVESEPLVYCADSDEPANQFYFWPEYNYRANRKGENAIYVSEAGLYQLGSGWFWKWLAHEPLNRADPPPVTLPPRIAQEFESVTDLGEHDIKIGDRVFHREHLWACYNLK